MICAQAGDSNAYHQLLSEISESLRPLLAFKIFAADQRDDVLQEILMALHKKKHTYRSEEEFKPWLYAIVRYKMIDYFRSRGRMAERNIFAGDLKQFDEVVSNSPEEMSKGLGPDLKILAEEVVAQLAPKQRRLIQLLKFEGYSTKESAQLLGMSESNVKVSLHRVIKELRAKFRSDES